MFYYCTNNHWFYEYFHNGHTHQTALNGSDPVIFSWTELKTESTTEEKSPEGSYEICVSALSVNSISLLAPHRFGCCLS